MGFSGLTIYPCMVTNINRALLVLKSTSQAKDQSKRLSEKSRKDLAGKVILVCVTSDIEIPLSIMA